MCHVTVAPAYNLHVTKLSTVCYTDTIVNYIIFSNFNIIPIFIYIPILIVKLTNLLLSLVYNL